MMLRHPRSACRSHDRQPDQASLKTAEPMAGLEKVQDVRSLMMLASEEGSHHCMPAHLSKPSPGMNRPMACLEKSQDVQTLMVLEPKRSLHSIPPRTRQAKSKETPWKRTKEQRNISEKPKKEGKDWLLTWNRNTQKSMTSVDASSETNCFPSPPKRDQTKVARFLNKATFVKNGSEKANLVTVDQADIGSVRGI